MAVAWTLHPAPGCGECDTMQVESTHRWTGTTLEAVSDNEESG